MSESVDVLVVGAGLSGLMAGVQAAQRGLRVVVLEGQPLAGGKYCYTSMGAAAVSNTGIDVSRFRGRDARFVDDALRAFPLADLRGWFGDVGVDLADAPHYGLVKPAEGGSAVIAALVEALEKAGGELRTNQRVTGIVRNEAGFIATCIGERLSAASLGLAYGAVNLPQLGGHPRSPKLAERLGHAVAEHSPALVAIAVSEAWPGTLPALWMDVRLKLYAGRRLLAESEGSMLFTSGALTGEAVFNISHAIEPALAPGEPVILEVNFHPGRTHDEVATWLHRTFGERTRELAEVALDYMIPRRLGAVFLAQQKLKPGVRVQQLDERHRQRLLHDMTATRLEVTGTLGMRAAESCTGGVSVREVDPRTFASRKVPGLYVVGRMLDVSADWGGFEQHFALASGFVAGRHIGIAEQPRRR